MKQSSEERKAVFKRIKRHADMGKWRAGPAHGLVVRLTTMDSAVDISFEALEAVVQYSKVHLDIEFGLVGGGTGCFDMILVTEEGKSTTLEEAIEKDPHYQVLLNELNCHLIRIRKPSGTLTFAAHTRIKAAFATNRERNAGAGVSPDRLFASNLSEELTCGFVEFLVMDLSRGQPRQSLLRRTWRKVVLGLGLGDIFYGKQSTIIDRVDVVGDQLKFQEILEKASVKGILVSIHGFANDFDDAMLATAKMVYRSRIEQLDLLPLIFSWPSPGKPAKYLPDVARADNSRISLGKLMQLLAHLPTAKRLSLIGHSHGCKILVEAICAMPIMGTQRFARTILVEPDVDARFLGQRIGTILKAATGLTVYHSSNDLALALSGGLHGAKRAGQIGPDTEMGGCLPPTVEIVDASRVASGLMRHSPHVDTIEVIADIRDLLEGKGPESRQYLEPTPEPNRWQIRSA